MFLLSSTLGDYFLDPTAPQYGRAQGKQECNEYLQKYGHPGYRVPQTTGFGSRYRKMLYCASKSDEGSPDWCGSIFKRVIARTINDSVYEEIQRAGGLVVFTDGSDLAWQAVEAGILSRLESDLSVLRHEMSWVGYEDLSNDNLIVSYLGLLNQPTGPGHHKKEEALRRMEAEQE